MTQVETGSTNVYADLGFENAEKMLVKPASRPKAAGRVSVVFA